MVWDSRRRSNSSVSACSQWIALGPVLAVRYVNGDPSKARLRRGKDSLSWKGNGDAEVRGGVSSAGGSAEPVRELEGRGQGGCG